VLGRALAIAAVGWVALLIAAPVLPAPLAAVLYAGGSFICHQRPERSFYVGEFQLPVCARCLGIYAGAAFAALAVSATLSRVVPKSYLDHTRRPSTTWGWPLLVTAVGAVPTAVTLVLEWAGLWATSNVVRAVAGAPLGAAVACVVVRAVATLHYDECAPRRPTASSPPRTPI
jgi:uncharacterized membrane protein